MKKCSKCGEEKELSGFYKNRNDCVQCCAIAAKIRYEKNPKESNSKSRKWYAENKEHAVDQHKEYRQRNAAKVFEMHKTYRNNNKDKIVAWWNASPKGTLSKARQLALIRRPTEKPVTTSELMGLWESQKGKCALSGEIMTWGRGGLKPTTISVDRINRKRGYSIDNVRLVCYQVNAFRGMWSDEQMLFMAKAIVKAEGVYIRNSINAVPDSLLT
ncbi:MAG: hypothetical protein NUV75_01870 [Gallionella sp.]|nr:hypothetical protein [Gallionella sp.]